MVDTAGLLNLVIYLAIGALVIWLVFYIVNMLNLDPAVQRLITIVIAVIVILWLISTLFPSFLPR